MSIQQIDIAIKDKFKYGLVAFLVDRDDFLTDIRYFREDNDLGKLPYSFPKSPSTKINNVINYYNKKICSIYDVYRCIQDIYDESSQNITSLYPTLILAVNYSKKLIKKYKKRHIYFPVILSAILTGEIHNSDLTSTYRIDISKDSLDELYMELIEKEALTAIIVNRESTWKELKATFSYIQKYHFGTSKVRPSNDDRLYNLFKEQLPKDKLQDTISNIINYRKWYWMYKDNKKPTDIAEEEHLTIDPKSIENAIYKYKNILEKPL